MDRRALIESRLRTALVPEALEIRDDSAQHAGHAGASGGAGYYTVTIVSSSFQGQSAVARHRMVYQALGDLMQREIHALQINALAPDEA